VTPAVAVGQADTAARDLSYSTLRQRRTSHAAWMLLCADHAPLILGFLADTYLLPNVRTLTEPEFHDALEDYLDRRRTEHPGSYPKSPAAYSADWVSTGWLHKRYPPGSDTATYEPTAAVERAIAFARSLAPQELVGTSSRLLVIQDLLRRLRVGGADDPQERVNELLRRRDAIDEEIRKINAGFDTKMDDAAIRETYNLAVEHARGLVSDMRIVDASVREIDRDVRRRAATWDGPRGEFLTSVFGSTDVIDSSDQGRTWQAFWQLLLDPAAQDELQELLDAAEHLPALAGRGHDLAHILTDDLFHAADATQRTFAGLSGQLRRFVDDATWAESRRIHDTLREFFAITLAVRDDDNRSFSSELPGMRADITMPLERPLYTAKIDANLGEFTAEQGDAEPDLSAVITLSSVDTVRLQRAIDSTLARNGGTATLGQVLHEHPLEEGLAELVGYLDIASRDAHSRDTDHTETITWAGEQDDTVRRTHIPAIVFTADSEDQL
jgi:hypothetical protein